MNLNQFMNPYEMDIDGDLAYNMAGPNAMEPEMPLDGQSPFFEDIGPIEPYAAEGLHSNSQFAQDPMTFHPTLPTSQQLGLSQPAPSIHQAMPIRQYAPGSFLSRQPSAISRDYWAQDNSMPLSWPAPSLQASFLAQQVAGLKNQTSQQMTYQRFESFSSGPQQVPDAGNMDIGSSMINQQSTSTRQFTEENIGQLHPMHPDFRARPSLQGSMAHQNAPPSDFGASQNGFPEYASHEEVASGSYRPSPFIAHGNAGGFVPPEATQDALSLMSNVGERAGHRSPAVPSPTPAIPQEESMQPVPPRGENPANKSIGTGKGVGRPKLKSGQRGNYAAEGRKEKAAIEKAKKSGVPNADERFQRRAQELARDNEKLRRDKVKLQEENERLRRELEKLRGAPSNLTPPRSSPEKSADMHMSPVSAMAPSFPTVPTTMGSLPQTDVGSSYLSQKGSVSYLNSSDERKTENDGFGSYESDLYDTD